MRPSPPDTRAILRAAGRRLTAASALLTVAVATLLFGGAFAATMALDSGGGPPVNLLVLPVALVALMLGGALGHYAERRARFGAELQESESGYRDLLGRLPAIVYTSEYGVDGEFLYV